MTVRQFMLKKYPTNEWMDCPVPKHHWEVIQEYADAYHKHLTEQKLDIASVSGSASVAVDKTVSDGLYCNCTLPNRNTTGNWCGTCNKMIAGNSVGRF